MDSTVVSAMNAEKLKDLPTLMEELVRTNQDIRTPEEVWGQKRCGTLLALSSKKTILNNRFVSQEGCTYLVWKNSTP